MNQDYLIQLTLTVYELSKDWEDTNFLKFKIRNLANEILRDFILLSFKNPLLMNSRADILKRINNFEQALDTGRTQKLIERQEFLLLRKEYENLKEELKELEFLPKIKKEESKKKLEEPKEQKPTERPLSEAELNQRQKKILEILEQKKQAQVWEFKQFFLNTSKRTLRRDLDDLLKKGLVQREGEWNKIFYALA